MLISNQSPQCVTCHLGVFLCSIAVIKSYAEHVWSAPTEKKGRQQRGKADPEGERTENDDKDNACDDVEKLPEVCYDCHPIYIYIYIHIHIHTLDCFVPALRLEV